MMTSEASTRTPETPSTGTPYAVQTVGLRKTYRTRRGRQAAVAGLDLQVPSGGVHGFLGPNGSGKTTTIRMLLGLVRPDSGEIRLFGEPIPDRLPAVIDRVGAIVEQPRFFPAFTGRRNLELLATAIGTPIDRVDLVLDEVGLADRARDRFRAYSLGMKQRLAIAATLLKDPDLLISTSRPTGWTRPASTRSGRPCAVSATGARRCWCPATSSGRCSRSPTR
jgi:ABC-2 type transport system ATP-binding protein